VAGLLPTKGMGFSYVRKNINSSGGYSFSITGETALVSVCDGYYGTTCLFLVNIKGMIAKIANISSVFEIEYAEGIFTVKSTSGNYDTYIAVLTLGGL